MGEGFNYKSVAQGSFFGSDETVLYLNRGGYINQHEMKFRRNIHVPPQNECM